MNQINQQIEEEKDDQLLPPKKESINMRDAFSDTEEESNGK